MNMKKIVVTILLLSTIVLVPAVPLHAQDWSVPTTEDCEALEAAYDAISRALTQAEIDVLPKEREIWDKEKELEDADHIKRDCEEKLKYCLLNKNREIVVLEEEIGKLEKELAGDKEDVANIQSEYEQVSREVQQWESEHSILEIFGGPGSQIATEGTGGWGVSTLAKGTSLVGKLLGPIGLAADLLGLGLTISEVNYFNSLIRHMDDAADRLEAAHKKLRTTEDALEDYGKRLSEKKAAQEEACPDERKQLKETEEQYDKVQGELEELKGQLDDLKKRIDELTKSKEEAWKAWWDCMHSRDTYELTVTAYQGGSVTLSSQKGTYQVPAGKTGKGPVTKGTEVTFTAIPEEGYTFDRWSGDASGTATTIKITIDWDKQVAAIFSPLEVTVPHMTGNPSVTSANVSLVQSVPLTINVPVTPDTDHVAYHIMGLDGDKIAIMAYVSGNQQSGEDSVIVITSSEHWRV
jgi:predicted  nucleic acid-binding Zn-ribbon protein